MHSCTSTKLALSHRSFATESHPATLIHPDAFDPDDIADFHHVFDSGNSCIRQFRDVDQTVLHLGDTHKAPRLYDRHDGRLKRVTDLNFSEHVADKFYGAPSVVGAV